MTRNIGTKLKEYRTKANMTVKEVSDYLTAMDYKAGEKTVYSWESGNSQPTPDILLNMCILYGIENVLEAFGYDHDDSLSKDKLDQVITAYTEASEPIRQAVDKLLDID